MHKWFSKLISRYSSDAKTPRPVMEILALDPTRFYCILFEDLNMIAQYYAILAELYLLSLAHRLALAT
jgi:hypothetical protein